MRLSPRTAATLVAALAGALSSSTAFAQPAPAQPAPAQPAPAQPAPAQPAPPAEPPKTEPPKADDPAVPPETVAPAPPSPPATPDTPADPTQAPQVAPPPPAPAPTPPAAEAAELPAPSPPPPPAPPATDKDELPNAGYVPGYRAHKALGLPPYAPRTGSRPGAITAPYGAPMPFKDWTFRFSGFLTATLQASFYERPRTAGDQGSLVIHMPPQVIDEYGSFLGTSTMPGQWVALNFAYGNSIVSANVSLNTWNPTQPTTYYQIGSQYFVNNAYLSFQIPEMGKLRLNAVAGYFYRNYGNLSQYGTGMYTAPVIGGPRGLGEVVTAEYDLGEPWSITFEHGFMGTRNGLVARDVVPSDPNGNTDATFPSAWIHHAHATVTKSGSAPSDPQLKAGLHYLYNWAQDDRAQRVLTVTNPAENTTTRQIDESNIPDSSLAVYGIDVTVNSPIWGFIGAAASYTRGKNVFPMRGLITFGGEGDQLTDRWWGGDTLGTGELFAASANYGASLGRIVSHPTPFTPGPDLVINTGFVVVSTSSDNALYDGRVRHKYGLDALYTFLSFMSAGLRLDRVVPNSKDSGESFEVVAPRLVFKTDWNSRDNLTLLYAKWFYGPRTHSEASAIRRDRLDDDLIALNVNMWW